jgi:hypothetical protein
MGSRFNYETNKPAVVVTTFVLLVSVVLSVSARLGTKYGLSRKLTHDDLAIIASLLFAILQDVCIALAVDSGYGDHQTDVSDGDLDQIMKVGLVHISLSPLSAKLNNLTARNSLQLPISIS